MHAKLPFIILIGILLFGFEANANSPTVGNSAADLEQICGVYFNGQADKLFCRQNALDYRSVASCGRSLEKNENRRLCIQRKTPYELMDTCDRYLVDEKHLLNCIKHTKLTATIHKCAEDNSFRPAKIHTCLNYLGMEIDNRDFDFEFSSDADLNCQQKDGERVVIKTIRIRRDSNGRLMASYKIDSGSFFTSNPSSKWFALSDSVLDDIGRPFAWKLASDGELSRDEAHVFFNRYLLPTIRHDQDTENVSTCDGSDADLVNSLLENKPSVLDSNRNGSHGIQINSGRQGQKNSISH